MNGTVPSRRWIVAMALMVTAGVTLPSPHAVAATTLERARSEGVLRIGFANEAPWAYLKPDGSLTGESPEVLRVLANRMGIARIEGVTVEFGSLIPGLQSKRFDVIATALYIRPNRCSQVAFTNPTIGVGNGLLVPKGNPKNLHAYDDVAKAADVKLGVVAGMVDHQYAVDAGVPADRIVQVPDTASLLEALRSGRVDAISESGPTIQLFADRTAGEFERALPFRNTEKQIGYGAFAVRKDDQDLLRALDAEIAGFVGTPDHLALVKPFGISAADLPAQGIAAQKVCDAR